MQSGTGVLERSLNVFILSKTCDHQPLSDLMITFIVSSLLRPLFAANPVGRSSHVYVSAAREKAHNFTLNIDVSLSVCLPPFPHSMNRSGRGHRQQLARDRVRATCLPHHTDPRRVLGSSSNSSSTVAAPARHRSHRSRLPHHIRLVLVRV